MRSGSAVVAASTPTAWSGGRRIWLARVALAAFALAVVVLVADQGRTGLTLMIVGLVGAAMMLTGGYWFIGRRGVLRWFGLVLVFAAVVFVVVVFVWQGDLLVALVSLALLALGGAVARTALRHSIQPWMPTEPATPASRPFIVMNPHSGGGKVAKFDLQRKAEALGAEVFLMEGPGQVDVAALVQDALARGADLLGVAGGDGTLALVAGIAARHGVPLMVISAGTRNHFALDLGLDREDPSSCLGALTDAEDVRVDLGMINGRPFVNNASFGAYAEVVSSPDYRENKNRTLLQMLPDLLSGERGDQLSVRTGRTVRADEAAILVSNNPYGDEGFLDVGRRARLDQGVLGVVAGRLRSATDAVSLLRRERYRPIVFLSGGGEVIVDSRSTTIPVGIDGESLTLDTPVHCTIQPRVLLVRLPRYRPGVPPQAGKIRWKALWRLASGHVDR